MRSTLLSLLAAVALLPASMAATAADEPRGSDGATTFEHWCLPCHGAGPGHPGTQALAAKYHGNPPALLGERTDLTPVVVKYFVRHGISVMAPFRRTEISDVELEALAGWLSGPRPAASPAP